ncbi:MAG: DMT family transporter [Pseudomonadota bacterium]
METAAAPPPRPGERPALRGRRRALAGHFAMLGFSALVAFSFTFGGLIARDIDPGVLTAARFIIATVVMGALALVLGQSLTPVGRRPWRWMVIGGLMAVYFILMFEALRLTSPIATAAIFTLTPLMAAGLGLGINGTRTGGYAILALVIGALGALWVIFRADLARALAFDLGRGEAIFLIGAVCHAAVPAMTRRLAPDTTPLQAAFGVLCGAVFVTCVYAAPRALATDFTAMGPMVWAVIFYLAIFATALTFFLIQVAIPRLSPGKVMAYTYLVPSWVVLHALVLGGSEPALIYGGIGLTLVALILLLTEDLAVPEPGPAPPA